MSDDKAPKGFYSYHDKPVKREKRDTLSARVAHSLTWQGVLLMTVLCVTSVAFVALGQVALAGTLIAGGVVGFVANFIGGKKE